MNSNLNNKLKPQVDGSGRFPESAWPAEPNQVVSPSGGTLIEDIKKVAEPLLRSLGLDLFDLQVSGGQLRIFVDKEGGVALEDCAKLSRLLSPALDVAECVPNAYRLEVSSPGLNRPLRNEKDFKRFIGKKVKIKTMEKIMDQKVFIGRLSDFNGGTIYITTDEGRQVELPFEKVQTACLEIEFPSLNQTKKG